MIGEVQFLNLESGGSSDNKLSFEVSNMHTSMLNAIRRTILGEIKNVGFCNDFGEKSIKINKNTTAVCNEIIEQRIAKLAIKASAFNKHATDEIYRRKSHDNYKSSQNELKSYKFSLKVSQKKHKGVTTEDFKVVTTDDFKVIKDNVLLETKIFFTSNGITQDSSIIIARFPVEIHGEPLELDIECYPIITQQKISSHFCPVAVSLFYIAGRYPRDRFVRIEGLGESECKSVTFNALLTLRKNIYLCLEELEDVFTNKSDFFGGNGINFAFKNMSQTLGKLVREWVDENEVLNRKIEHVSYFESKVESKEIILKIILKNNILEYDEYLKESMLLLAHHLTTLHDALTDAEEKWKTFCA
jgi:hypothetical protein